MLRRRMLERRMEQQRTLQPHEFAALLRVWANNPRLLWGELQGAHSTWRIIADATGKYVYDYDDSDFWSPKSAGKLFMPDRLAIIAIERRVDLDEPELLTVRITVDAAIETDPRPLSLTVVWRAQQEGVVVSVSEYGCARRKRLCRVVRSRYGWTVGAATVSELVMMYFTHALPEQVIQQARQVGVS